MKRQWNGACAGSACFRLRFRNDPPQLGPASDDEDDLFLPVCGSGVGATSFRLTRSARLSSCSLSPRCFTCANFSVSASYVSTHAVQYMIAQHVRTHRSRSTVYDPVDRTRCVLPCRRVNSSRGRGVAVARTRRRGSRHSWTASSPYARSGTPPHGRSPCATACNIMLRVKTQMHGKRSARRLSAASATVDRCPPR